MADGKLKDWLQTKLPSKVQVRSANNKWNRLVVAGVIMLSTAIPLLTMIQDVKAYQLTPETLDVIGSANKNLSAKFSFDPMNNVWQFNKSGLSSSQASDKQVTAASLAQLQAQIGGGGKQDSTLYSANLSADPTKGITYFDNNTQLSFSMVPNFSMRQGKMSQGRVVYPFKDGGQLVYTAKTNGMKEDIVLAHDIGDWLRFNYTFNLPDTLEARMQDDGSVGIYSADPALFGNISFGSDVDQAKVMDARVNAPKNNLVFSIPAPIIKDKAGQVSTATYALDGNRLYVTADGLSKLKYPLSVDPSVVITSSSDFSTGNNEDNIDFGSGQINRSDVTGGSIDAGGWSTDASTFTSSRYGQGTVIYNNVLYVVGGRIPGSIYNSDVQYAQLSYPTSTTTSVGTWSTAASGFTNGRQGMGVVAYNGYLYVMGGFDGTTTYSDIQYAKFSTASSGGLVSDAGCGSMWCTATTTLPTAMMTFGSFAYNGNMYILGGYDGTSTTYANTYYVPIKANGSITSSFTSTTALSSVRRSFGATVYNGQVYVVGGRSGGSRLSSTERIAINSDGSFASSWVTLNSFTTARQDMSVVAARGYLYLVGGQNATTVYTDTQYAPILANGSIGKWTTSSATVPYILTNAGVIAENNGFLYVAGGFDSNTTFYNNVLTAKIDLAGMPVSYTTGSQINTTAVTGGSTFVFGNRIFLVGGYNGTTYTNAVLQAPLNSNGTVGTWASTTSMGTAAGGCAFAFYSGYIYCVGGFTVGGSTISTTQYAKVNLDGTLTWSTTTSLPVTTGQHGGAAYGGYLFAVGNGGGGTTANVYAAPINSNGTIGSWTLQTQTLNTGRNQEGMVAYNGYLYVVGGANSGGTYLNSVERAVVNTSPGSAATVLGSFSTTTSFNSARGDGFGIAIAGGYIYIAGGSDAGGALSSLEFAKFNSNGSLGTWSSLTMPNTQKSTSMAISGSVLYLTSGNIAGSRDKHVELMYLNNGGSGLPTTKTTLNTLGTAVGQHTTVAYNGYLYVAGGTGSGGQVATVQYAAINPDGTVGSWSTTTSLPTVRSGARLAAYNGYMYVVGGNNASTYYNDAYYIAINSNGTLGASWTATSSFINGRYNFGMVNYHGYLYIMGGDNGTTTYNDVQYAALNSNGTIGSWHYTHNSTDDSTTFVSGFTTARTNRFISVANNGYLYVGGGLDGSANPLGDIQYAAINSNGTIGSWSTTTSFPGQIYNTAATAYNGSLCVYGGSRVIGSSTADGSEVFCSQFGVNGTLETWQQAFVTAGPASSPYVKFAAVAVYNGNAYFSGGATGSGPYTYTNAVYALGMDAIARGGHYSTLVNLGTSATLNSVYYNSSSAYNASLQYKYADSTGVLGSLTSGTRGTGSDPGNLCTPGTTQYIWVYATMDDSQDYSFPASSGSSITDITFYYGASSRPTPPQRLHGGKYFSGEVLQPLDLCGP